MINPREVKELVNRIETSLNENTKIMKINVNCNEDLLTEQKKTNKLLTVLLKATRYLNRGIDIIGAAISPESYGLKPHPEESSQPESDESLQPEPGTPPPVITATPPLSEPEEPPPEIPDEIITDAPEGEVDKEQIRQKLESEIEDQEE